MLLPLVTGLADGDIRAFYDEHSSVQGNYLVHFFLVSVARSLCQVSAKQSLQGMFDSFLRKAERIPYEQVSKAVKERLKEPLTVRVCVPEDRWCRILGCVCDNGCIHLSEKTLLREEEFRHTLTHEIIHLSDHQTLHCHDKVYPEYERDECVNIAEWYAERLLREKSDLLRGFSRVFKQSIAGSIWYINGEVSEWRGNEAEMSCPSYSLEFCLKK